MSKVNKSQLIRDFHLAHPSAKPMQIAEALKQQKVKVTNLYVSLILSKLKNQTVNEKGEFIPAKRGRKPKVEAVVVAPAKRGRPKTEAVNPAKRGRKPASEMAVFIKGLREVEQSFARLAAKLEQQVA